MKKTLAIILSLLTLASLIGCNSKTSQPSQPPADTIEGTAEEVLVRLQEETNKLLPSDKPLPKSFEDQVTAENCQGTLGISPEDFAEYVEEAYSASAAIMTIAHEVALVKCKDAAAAGEVKALIAAGFDSGKWICVHPKQSAVVDSGSFVLLAVSEAETVDALIEAFSGLAGGNVGEADIFYAMP